MQTLPRSVYNPDNGLATVVTVTYRLFLDQCTTRHLSSHGGHCSLQRHARSVYNPDTGLATVVTVAYRLTPGQCTTQTLD